MPMMMTVEEKTDFLGFFTATAQENTTFISPARQLSAILLQPASVSEKKTH